MLVLCTPQTLATAHHQETWNPNWNLRTLVLSLRGFMTTQPREIGSINTDAASQRNYATLSRYYSCPHCGIKHTHLSPEDNSNMRFSTPNPRMFLTKEDESLLKLSRSLASKTRKLKNLNAKSRINERFSRKTATSNKGIRNKSILWGIIPLVLSMLVLWFSSSTVALVNKVQVFWVYLSDKWTV